MLNEDNKHEVSARTADLAATLGAKMPENATIVPDKDTKPDTCQFRTTESTKPVQEDEPLKLACWHYKDSIWYFRTYVIDVLGRIIKPHHFEPMTVGKSREYPHDFDAEKAKIEVWINPPDGSLVMSISIDITAASPTDIRSGLKIKLGYVDESNIVEDERMIGKAQQFRIRALMNRAYILYDDMKKDENFISAYMRDYIMHDGDTTKMLEKSGVTAVQEVNALKRHSNLWPFPD